MRDIWEAVCDYAFLRFRKGFAHADARKWANRWYNARMNRQRGTHGR